MHSRIGEPLCVHYESYQIICFLCIYKANIVVILLPSEFNPPYNQTFYNGMLYEKTGYQLSKQNQWNKKVFASLS